MEENLISNESMHCGLDYKEYNHHQCGDEQKLYTIQSVLIVVRDSANHI